MCLPIIGAVISGVGAAMGAAAQSASHKAQANFERRQARLEQDAGAYKAARVQDNVNRVTGSQRAGFAASGLALSGSPQDVILDSTEEGALDVAAIRWNSRLAGENLRYKAQMSDMNANAAAASAPIAFLTPVINGVAKYSSSFAGFST